MKSNYIEFNIENSINRVKEILDAKDESFEESKVIPSRENLTFTNGYYVWVSVIYIDIRDSSNLISKLTFKQIARLYRCYISEVVAILNGFDECHEVYIEGDGVWSVFNTPFKSNIYHIFEAAAKINSFIQILNLFYFDKNLPKIKVGIGLDYNKALMIKTGHKGSTINEVNWTGESVSNAVSLCKKASKNYNKTVMLSKTIYNNLSERYKGFCSWDSNNLCYQANIIDTELDNLLNQK